RVHLSLAASVLLVVGLVAARALLEVPAPHDVEEPPLFALPTGPVLLIGIVGFCAIFAESASSDWCAVYLHRVTGTAEATAAAAYAAYALTMTTGRFLGDAVVERAGAV